MLIFKGEDAGSFSIVGHFEEQEIGFKGTVLTFKWLLFQQIE